jgi:hypothetical protein
MLSNLLLFRLVIVNTVGAVASFYAYQQGYISELFTTDTTNISYAILALFVVGLVSTFNRAWKVSAAINEWKAIAFIDSDAPAARLRASKLDVKNSHIADIAKWLAYLGLLGTIIGLKMAINGSALDNTAAIQTGLAVAVNTTIAGAILCFWTWVNLRMLDTATHSFMADVENAA